jgi:hypothetical protein
MFNSHEFMTVMTPMDATQLLKIGWQIADIARHFKVTNEQVVCCPKISTGARRALRERTNPRYGKGRWEVVCKFQTPVCDARWPLVHPNPAPDADRIELIS